MEEFVAKPLIQGGFVGFSAVLLAVVIWLINRLLAVLQATGGIIAANTEAINRLTAMTRDLLVINRSLHDKLISRPCIAREE